jgi:hypothetical protein
MDILEQFREQQRIAEQKLPPFIPDHDWLSWGDAADEIERLRDRVLLLEGYLNGALNVVEGFVHCDTKEARKALGEKE